MSKATQSKVATDRAPIFGLIRLAIAKELQEGNINVGMPDSQLELSISTFAPSTLMHGFEISDYPFIGARYVSVHDGHVYSIYGATDDGQQLIAYRMPFIRSCLTSRGGLAVAVSEAAWMRGRMILFSITHVGMNFQDGELMGVADHETRRSFPEKKARAFRMHSRESFILRLRHIKERVDRCFGKGGEK